LGTTREGDRYGASATVNYSNSWDWTLFGSENMRFLVTGASFGAHSNLDFYRLEAMSDLAGMALRRQ